MSLSERGFTIAWCRYDLAKKKNPGLDLDCDHYGRIRLGEGGTWGLGGPGDEIYIDSEGNIVGVKKRSHSDFDVISGEDGQPIHCVDLEIIQDSLNDKLEKMAEQQIKRNRLISELKKYLKTDDEITGVKCPEDGCNGELILKKGSFSNSFTCNKHHKCNFSIFLLHD